MRVHARVSKGQCRRQHAQELQWQRQREAAGLPPRQGGLPAWTPTPAAGGNPSFDLANQGSLTIREVYVSLSTQQNWGPDRLGQNVLNPGQRLQVSLPAGNATATPPGRQAQRMLAMLPDLLTQAIQRGQGTA